MRSDYLKLNLVTNTDCELQVNIMISREANIFLLIVMKNKCEQSEQNEFRSVSVIYRLFGMQLCIDFITRIIM